MYLDQSDCLVSQCHKFTLQNGTVPNIVNASSEGQLERSYVVEHMVRVQGGPLLINRGRSARDFQIQLSSLPPISRAPYVNALSLNLEANREDVAGSRKDRFCLDRSHSIALARTNLRMFTRNAVPFRVLQSRIIPWSWSERKLTTGNFQNKTAGRQNSVFGSISRKFAQTFLCNDEEANDDQPSTSLRQLD